MVYGIKAEVGLAVAVAAGIESGRAVDMQWLNGQRSCCIWCTVTAIEYAVKNNLSIRSLQKSENKLEDVFKSLTKKE